MTPFDQTIPLSQLHAFQLDALNRQIVYAKTHSPYYRRILASMPLPLPRLEDITRLPFLTAEQLACGGPELVCLPSSRIQRIVSLQTSGSVHSKRLYFSENDLERTIAFFSAGMRYMTALGQTVAVCMPGSTPNGISDLLCRGLKRLGARPVHIGSISDYASAAESLRSCRPHTIVGIPYQIRRLALLAPDLRPANVLLSSDYLPSGTEALLQRQWHCQVFDHYGLTESGYGCAVECPHHEGAHIRHDELILEIVDPVSGAPLPPGNWGEIVLTTLHREAMPLLRYRTGDCGRLLTQPCACGSVLPRLDRVAGRVCLLEETPNIYQLEDLLSGIDSVLDFTARRISGGVDIRLLTLHPTAVEAVRRELARLFPDHEMSVHASDSLTVSLGKRKIL